MESAESLLAAMRKGLVWTHPFNTRSGYTALLWTRCPRESALRHASNTLEQDEP